MISSKEDKPITSLSPFIIEKQIESLIGTPKNVKKLKNGTLLVETNRKSQTDNLLKLTKFFNINVTVTEHKTLNSCKGIIRDRMLKHETEENITEYLNTQGVTACKRFKVKKDGNFIETNTLLLTFNAGLGGSVGCAVRLETRRSRVQPPPRSATFIRGD